MESIFIKRQKAIDIANKFISLVKDASDSVFQDAFQELIEKKNDDEIWQLIPAKHYGLLLKKLYHYLKQFKNSKETLDIMVDFCDCYKNFKHLDNSDLKEIHEILGYLYVKNNDERAAYGHFIDSTISLMADTNWYEGFEYFSFRSFSDYSLEEIEKNVMWLSYPGTFNDPMDTILLRWNKYMKDNAADDVERVCRLLFEKVYEHLKVRSLVRIGNLPDPTQAVQEQLIENINPLMWAHYARDHKGFCIKYKFPSEFLTNVDKEERQCTRINGMIYKDEMVFDKSSNFKLTDALLAKHRVWKYENEVRIIHFDANNDENYKSIPLPEDSIQDIYLGIKCSDENRDKMIRLLRNKNIRLYQMKVDDVDCYKLSKERIL